MTQITSIPEWFSEYAKRPEAMYGMFDLCGSACITNGYAMCVLKGLGALAKKFDKDFSSMVSLMNEAPSGSEFPTSELQAFIMLREPCKLCAGKGRRTCPNCHGRKSYSCTCDNCDDEHTATCGECDDNGQAACKCSESPDPAMIHGIPIDRRNLRDFIPFLSDVPYRVIVKDNQTALQFDSAEWRVMIMPYRMYGKDEVPKFPAK